MQFSPSLHDTIEIEDEQYAICAHPRAPTMVYGQEGAKAIVYKVQRLSDKTAYALKVFKEKYRKDDGLYIREISRRIGVYSSLPGMLACNRMVLSQESQEHLLAQYPELEHAVLMPWVSGQTWHDIMPSQKLFSLEQYLIMAREVAHVLHGLETRGIAHCDISSANVLLDVADPNNPDIHLIDVEDIFGVNLPPPVHCPRGTDGYFHLSSRINEKGQWCAEGDLFAGAILVAEILAWHDTRIRGAAYKESYFSPDEMQDTTVARYQLILEILKGISPDLSELFASAWTSATLADCPSMERWASVLDQTIVVHRTHETFKKIVTGDRDLQIHQAWMENRNLLGSLPQAMLYERRAKLATKRVRILERLQTAHTNSDDEAVWKIYLQYQMILESSKDFQQYGYGLIDSARVRLRQSAEKQVRQAIWIDDDLAIEQAYDGLLFENSNLFDDVALVRIDLARSRVKAMKQLEAAIQARKGKDILQIYEDSRDLLRTCSSFGADHLIPIQHARRSILYQDFQEALTKGTESQIVTTGLEALDGGCTIQDADFDRIRIAHLRVSILNRLRGAIAADDDMTILLAYNGAILDHLDELTIDERERVKTVLQ